jgi:hypothetical protein
VIVGGGSTGCSTVPLVSSDAVVVPASVAPPVAPLVAPALSVPAVASAVPLVVSSVAAPVRAAEVLAAPVFSAWSQYVSLMVHASRSTSP